MESAGGAEGAEGADGADGAESQHAADQDALRGYLRYRAFAAGVWFVVVLVMMGIAIDLTRTHSLLFGVVLLLVGSPVVGAVLLLAVVRPIGYLIWGKDAMSLRHTPEDRP